MICKKQKLYHIILPVVKICPLWVFVDIDKPGKERVRFTNFYAHPGIVRRL